MDIAAEVEVEVEVPGERAKTPTQGSMEARDEAKTPTRSSFRKGKNTPSVIVTAAAGEPISSANSQRESVNSSSTTPSRMDRMVGAIKNVTQTPPAVHVPVAFNKRSMGASSGGSFGGSSSGGASYTKQVLRLHDGPVDPSTLSSAPPQEIIIQVLEVLKSLGIEYTKDSEFRYRCVRPKKRKPMVASREASGSGTPNLSATPGANGVSFDLIYTSVVLFF
jgi:protein-serine/threonine kinase